MDDSLTQEAEWGDMLPGWSVANRGIAGDGVDDLALRWRSILKMNPARVYVMVGVNDVLAGTRIEDIVSSYRELLRVMGRQGLRVVVQATVRCNVNVCGSASVSRINLLNAKLEVLARDEGAMFLDLGDLINPEGLPASYSYDGVHLSASGYKEWLKHLTEHVSQLDGPESP